MIGAVLLAILIFYVTAIAGLFVDLPYFVSLVGGVAGGWAAIAVLSLRGGR